MPSIVASLSRLVPEDLRSKWICDEEFVIGCHLIRCRFCSEEQQNFFKPFADVLPLAEELSMSEFFAKEDEAYLCSKARIDKIHRRNERLKAKFQTVDTEVYATDRRYFPADVFSFRNWCWGHGDYGLEILRLSAAR